MLNYFKFENANDEARIKKFNLQLFAGEPEPEPEPNPEPQTDPKLFTQEELDAIVSKRLAKEKTKLEEERKVLLAKAEQEKELAKLSEKERAQKEFELKQSEFEKERQEFQRQKLELETVKELDKRSLPVEFSSMVLGEGSEDTLERINTFEKQWQIAIEKAVNERMKGTTPKKASSDDVVTKEEFSKWGYNKRLELKNKNPKLYDELIGG